MPGKGYRVDTDFKLRPDRRKKRAKAALVALAIMVLLEGYLFLHYLSWLGKTGEPPGIVAFMTSMGALFTFFPTVPLFSADTWRALGRMYLAGLPVSAWIPSAASSMALPGGQAGRSDEHFPTPIIRSLWQRGFMLTPKTMT